MAKKLSADFPENAWRVLSKLGWDCVYRRCGGFRASWRTNRPQSPTRVCGAACCSRSCGSRWASRVLLSPSVLTCDVILECMVQHKLRKREQDVRRAHEHPSVPIYYTSVAIMHEG